jgi:hypothetical protein
MRPPNHLDFVLAAKKLHVGASAFASTPRRVAQARMPRRLSSIVHFAAITPRDAGTAELQQSPSLDGERREV